MSNFISKARQISENNKGVGIFLLACLIKVTFTLFVPRIELFENHIIIGNFSLFPWTNIVYFFLASIIGRYVFNPKISTIIITLILYLVSDVLRTFLAGIALMYAFSGHIF